MQPKRPLTPTELLHASLAPIGQAFGNLGASHCLVGFLPAQNVVHFVSDANTHAKRAAILRQMAVKLNDFADNLEKQPGANIIQPGAH